MKVVFVCFGKRIFDTIVCKSDWHFGKWIRRVTVSICVEIERICMWLYGDSDSWFINESKRKLNVFKVHQNRCIVMLVKARAFFFTRNIVYVTLKQNATSKTNFGFNLGRKLTKRIKLIKLIWPVAKNITTYLSRIGSNRPEFIISKFPCPQRVDGVSFVEILSVACIPMRIVD